MKPLTLILLPEKLAICRLPPSAPIPPWATTSAFFSITRTDDELSLVCSSASVPEEIKCEKDWIAYKVAGPLDFRLTGILASIANPLANAKISIFAISTYDTDYILIKGAHLTNSIKILEKAGFIIQNSSHTLS